MLQPAQDDSFLPIEALLERIEGLSRQALPSPEFHAQLLRDLVDSLAAEGGVVWVRAGDGTPRADCQIQPRLLQLDTDPHIRRLHAVILEQLAARPRTRILPPDSHDGTLENATPYELCFQPVHAEGRWEAVIELFFAGDDRRPTADSLCDVLDAVTARAGEHYWRAKLAELEQQNVRLFRCATFLGSLDGQVELSSWAAHLVGAGRSYYAADRIGLLVRRGRRCRLIAISGADTIQRRSEPLRRLERLAQAVLVSGPLYPTTDTQELAPQLEGLLAGYLEECSATSLALLPLQAPADDESNEKDAAASGVLLLEWYDATPPADLVQRAADTTAPLARRLEVLRQQEQLPLLPIARGLRACGLHREGSWGRMLTVTGLILAALLAALIYIPANLTVTATGHIEPVVRAGVFAPADGIVSDLPAATRETVQRGDVLAVLRSPELDRQWNEVWGQLQTTEQSLTAAQAARLQLGRGGEATVDGLAAQQLELTAVRDGLLKQLARLEHEQEQLTLRSPLDGTIVTWDLQQLTARPVRHGELLLRVMDTEGSWQLRLNIPEARAGHVLARLQHVDTLPVTFMLESAPVETYEGRLTEVAESASLGDEGPALQARVAIERPATAALRPGSAVTARIHCGQRSLGYVWLHRVWEAILLRTF